MLTYYAPKVGVRFDFNFLRKVFISRIGKENVLLRTKREVIINFRTHHILKAQDTKKKPL